MWYEVKVKVFCFFPMGIQMIQFLFKEIIFLPLNYLDTWYISNISASLSISMSPQVPFWFFSFVFYLFAWTCACVHYCLKIISFFLHWYIYIALNKSWNHVVQALQVCLFSFIFILAILNPFNFQIHLESAFQILQKVCGNAELFW